MGINTPGLSQNRAAKKWYFGNSTNGITFNRPNSEAVAVDDQVTPFGIGGSATATDPATGNLLFYTDGSRVYDACHNLMPNGAALNGNSTGNQPVAISTIPGQVNKYYVFTNTGAYPAGGNIDVTVVDMGLPGSALAGALPLGNVESSNTATGLTNRSEGMITVPHDNGTDMWLITHENNSANYSATLIDAATYGAGAGTIFRTTASAGVGNVVAVAHLTYSPSLKKIAVAAHSPNDNSLILDFDDATGNITFDRFIENTAVATNMNNPSVYDIAWSPNGRYLYLSRYGNNNTTADLLQYDYNTPSTTLASVLPNPIFRSYGLQIANDTAIYHLYQNALGGAFLLGKLTEVDLAANQVVYESSPLNIANFSGSQFPAFLSDRDINLNVSFSSSGSCENAPTTFFATVNPAVDSLVWDFGDGQTGTGFSPIHTYASANTYTVSLTAFYNNQQQQSTQAITINAFPLSIQLVQDTTACRGEFPPPRGSSMPNQFQVVAQIEGGTPTSSTWSNGDMGTTLLPDSAGYYYLVVTDASGCATYAGVNVKEYELEDQSANIWYFGNRAGIDFNTLPNPPVALNNSAMNAPAGTSTVSDRNGEVIFYTDGDRVYDKTHTRIANGIGGSPTSAQAALIVPVPNDETLYYIFTTKATGINSRYELRYSLFDIKQNNGRGAVVEQNILLYTKSTERITANDSWLVSHEYGNNTFRAYPLTEEGIGNPVFSDIGSAHSFKNIQTGAGYMKLHSNDTIAVALSNPGVSNLIEVFHLNRDTGIIDNYKQIDLNEPNGQVYGIEFSSGGNKIFATLKGSPAPSTVYEYYFDTNGDPMLRRNTPAPTLELGALQTGPDGQIYMAINGSNELGTIQPVEDKTRESNVNFSGFALAPGTNSRLGLPNFTQIVANSASEPGITISNLCLGDSTSFTATTTDAIDEVQWLFGDGMGDTSTRVKHVYSQAGTYNVSMRITNRCGLDTTLTQTITINPEAVRPTNPGAIALCTGTAVLDANSNNLPGYTYQWSSGETTKTITVTTSSIVSVTNTTQAGCTATAETFVSANRPILDLGMDITRCTSTTPIQLDAQNPGATYQWTINGVNTSTVQIQEVDLSAPGAYTYEVTVTDPVTNCSLVESKVFTIMTAPNFTLSGTDPTACNTTDGTITLQFNRTIPASGPYSYTITGPSVNQQGSDQNANTTIGPITGLGAGGFSATVTDQISGCSMSGTVGVSDPGGFMANFTNSDCDPTEITASITGGNPVNPVLYTYTNNTTGQVVGPIRANTAQFSPGEGTYTVIAHDDNGNGCRVVTTNNAMITQKVITITANTCSDPATLTANFAGASAYAWTGPGIVSGANTGTITINTSGNYEVTATTPTCDVTGSQEVIYNIATANFSQSDACTSSVLLTASPSGSYTYRWYKEGVFQNTLLGPVISLGRSEDGSNYAVHAVSTVNGCIYQSANKQVNVVGPIDASIDPVEVCDDDTPFTLMANTMATGISYSWFFNGILIPNESSATSTQVRGGLYGVDISKSICTTRAEMMVTKLPLPPEGKLPKRVSICDNPENVGIQESQIVLDPGQHNEYEWFKNDTALGINTQTLTVTSEGTYKVIFKNEDDCVNSDQIEVLNICIPVIKAPNAFRPDSNEEINKTFSLFTFFITNEFSILIYNRWGELIYYSNDRFFKWDGIHQNNNQPVPTGTYAYVIKYINSSRPELGTQEQRGSVVLLR